MYTVVVAVLCTWWTVPILLRGVRTLDTTYVCVMVWWLRDHVLHTRLRGCAGDVVVLMGCVRVWAGVACVREFVLFFLL
jgi:hypothetical protein